MLTGQQGVHAWSRLCQCLARQCKLTFSRILRVMAALSSLHIGNSSVRTGQSPLADERRIAAVRRPVADESRQPLQHGGVCERSVLGSCREVGAAKAVESCNIPTTMTFPCQ